MTPSEHNSSQFFCSKTGSEPFCVAHDDGSSFASQSARSAEIRAAPNFLVCRGAVDELAPLLLLLLQPVNGKSGHVMMMMMKGKCAPRENNLEKKNQ